MTVVLIAGMTVVMRRLPRDRFGAGHLFGGFVGYLRKAGGTDICRAWLCAAIPVSDMSHLLEIAIRASGFEKDLDYSH
jgi:hypothetical protein